MSENHTESQSELAGRIELIESMMLEGRRKFEYWGWSQVLWGSAYLIAIGWSSRWGRPDIAWPVTMIAATVITIAVASFRKRAHPPTTLSRSLRAIWISLGLGIFIYCFSMGSSGHLELHSWWTTIEILLGAANLSAALILRWRAQFIVAAVWWVSAVATCFVGDSMVMPVLVAATLVGMIGFGFYLMYCERRDRQARAQHA